MPDRIACQRTLDRRCVQVKKDEISGLLVEPRDRARWLAIQRKESGAWLLAPPVTALGLRMSPEVIRISSALRLGADVCEPHKCICGVEVDSTGVHALSCERSAGRHSRHSALNNIIHAALTTCNIPSSLEPKGLLLHDEKRPDGLSLIPWQRGKCLLWDATVTDTLAPSHLRLSSVSAGTAANKAAVGKTRKYSELLRAYHFVPVAIETLGVFGDEAAMLLREIGRRLISTTKDTRQFSYLKQRVSVAIQRGNAASILGTVASACVI